MPEETAMLKVRYAIGVAIVLLSCAGATARAETNEVRLAQQTSMGYMQFSLMDRFKLIEKYAKAAGLGDVKVFWDTFNGPNNMNDALLAGRVDFVSGGVPGLVTLWEKTAGTPQEVRGVSAMSSQPFFLNTRDANVKSLRDLSAKDKIAVPAVKVSVQAVTLQMAAAKEFGEANFSKLDEMTVSVSPPPSAA
jgi:NitT/TauT family transport system substrate-binding protein